MGRSPVAEDMGESPCARLTRTPETALLASTPAQEHPPCQPLFRSVPVTVPSCPRRAGAAGAVGQAVSQPRRPLGSSLGSGLSPSLPELLVRETAEASVPLGPEPAGRSLAGPPGASPAGRPVRTLVTSYRGGRFPHAVRPPPPPPPGGSSVGSAVCAVATLAPKHCGLDSELRSSLG